MGGGGGLGLAPRTEFPHGHFGAIRCSGLQVACFHPEMAARSKGWACKAEDRYARDHKITTHHSEHMKEARRKKRIDGLAGLTIWRLKAE